MYLTIGQQKKGKVVNTQQSKFSPYSFYKMYKYLWKPSEPVVNENEVAIDYDTKAKLADIWKKLQVRKQASIR